MLAPPFSAVLKKTRDPSIELERDQFRFSGRWCASVQNPQTQLVRLIRAGEVQLCSTSQSVNWRDAKTSSLDGRICEVSGCNYCAIHNFARDVRRQRTPEPRQQAHSRASSLSFQRTFSVPGLQCRFVVRAGQWAIQSARRDHSTAQRVRQSRPRRCRVSIVE